MRVISVYSDGGVVERNPSPFGGTWACCASDEQGFRQWEHGGYVLADPGELITNNQMEFIAALMALEALDDGWNGTLYTDSQLTIERIHYARVSQDTDVVPRGLNWRYFGRMVRVLKRLGAVELAHLKGHPTRVELKAGRSRTGSPVSHHQAWCDAECKRQASLVRLLVHA